MTLSQRFNSWVSEKRQSIYWVAYRLTYPISDKISEDTEYSTYLRSADVDDTTRLYISLTLLYSLLVWISVTILSNLVLIPFGWLAAIAGFAENIIQVTNIALLFQGVADGLVGSFDTLVQTSSQIDFDSLAQVVESSLRQVGESIRVIGAVLLAAVTVFDVILEPVISVGSEVFREVQLTTSPNSSDGLGNILDTVASVLPDRETIRNIISIIVAPILALIYLGGRLYWPVYLSSERGRKIDAGLDRSYTFMYALSEGGLGIYEVMCELADAEDAYGEVSVTFRKIVRDANKGNESLAGSILEISKETPSEDLSDFLDGLVNAIDTGSNINSYMESQANRALKSARDKQKNRLNLYELISETYVILFVAAPIFFLILQLVQAMTGGLNRGATQFVPYALIPVGGLMIGSVIYFTGSSSSLQHRDLSSEVSSKWYDIEKHANTSREFESLSHRVSERLSGWKSTILAPIYKLRMNPRLSLVMTVPLAILFVAGAIQVGLIPTSSITEEQAQELSGVDGSMSLTERIDANAMRVTLAGMYAPLVIILLPWTILYDLRRRKREKVVKQLPQMFKSIAEANKRGLTLQESLETTAQTSNSELYNQLQRSIRRSKFTNDINGALTEFANRMRVPRLSQSTRLLVKANKVSSNVTVVVEAVADDLESYYNLRTDRKQRVRVYVVIMFMSFLISSGVLIALDVTFFGFISEQVASNESNARNSASYGQDLPIEFFRRVFIHTLFFLALVSGFVAGMMENGEIQNGFKYALAMVTLGLFGFGIAPFVL